ncbi:polyphosphate polymerase domain-containing protein [Arthrobacter sp. 35W]|uniref:polyphosphate polymerase domain-containing protein n=1 Tax=Arthrobacter sp. 35W TaxID=1132441 RepID=UPI0003FA7D04|nr:polyphosphate polymerase domain-containing protein [Arthrobacter sp. 35W]
MSPLGRHTALGPWLSQLPPLSLEALNAAAALQTRVDRKYLVPLEKLSGILDSFAGEVHILQEAGLRLFAYDSVYFDTPALDSYFLAAFGRRRRYKIRTRSYLDSGVAFLEVKTEGSRSATVKERIPYDPSDRSTITPEGAEYIAQTLQATALLPPPGPLAPVLETSYGRTTLYLPGSNSRATVDFNVTWTTPRGERLVLGDAVVLETKSGSTTGQLDKHLWRHGVRPSRISKFATGMAALTPGLPANRWHQTLMRSMPRPSTTPRTTS